MEIMDYIFFIFKLIVFSGALLLVLVALLKNGESKIKVLSKGKYVKIIEKTQVDKNKSIYIFKFGEEGAVIFSSEKGMEKIKDLNKEEIKVIEENKEKLNDDIRLKYNEGISIIKNSLGEFLGKFKREKR
ncbi:hypothetical protein [Clostridium mediterraneense]|uniref:hypothetical protein n=1 Tax=Clostridium mediterraneense TaxID=1805472 RepID=UPI0008348814|nr:hypothetical protein [Clostridium mediterraneense]